MIKYKEFALEDIFCKIKSPKIKGKAADFPTTKKGNYKIPLLTAGVENQGLSRFAKEKDCPKIISNVISISANGANTGATFYQDDKFAILQDAYAIKLRAGCLNREVGLYLTSLLNKKLHGSYDWSNKATWNRIKKLTIKIPILDDESINYNYINNYIAELEQQRLAELEQQRLAELDSYLKATNLDDYLLTDEDRKVLDVRPKHKYFKIIDLFNVVNTHSILKSQIAKLEKGSTPYLTAAEGNNAVSKYINCPDNWKDQGNCVFIGGKTMVVTYQEKDFCSNDSHNLALYFKDKKYRTPLIQQYFVGSIKKALSEKYSWGDSISKSKIKKDIISLPIDKQDNIDFQYMEDYIKAIQKLTIKNVVKYKDKVISTTSDLINKVKY
ncbi:putative type II restriction enzyme [Lactobacillus gasseri SV-16A-US]|uniref:Restriction enzyme BgcI subunit beta n=2 Tax=Lactobacillus gasseri TaxID=1596 RepID=A0ABY3BE04_LACGS|nr:restriction endonuclease subunit S [Lactobacillus gasseri]KFL96344.1 putative type II restriction enzyme [Lactobacillus gasseri SV-16A-US]TQW15335.1 Restriction enzyme BgcI subunit beta [Lactobacillus gasseri]